MAKTIKKSALEVGERGVECTKQFCKANNIPFVKASRDQDLQDGIDCFVDGVPTDVKNTEDIYFINVDVKYGTINTRHPFKKNSLATCYAMVKASETEEKFIEHTNINILLGRDFLKEDKVEEFKTFLQTLDQTHFSAFERSVSLSQFCWKVKEYVLKNFVKGSTKVLYPTISNETEQTEISMRLVKGKGEGSTGISHSALTKTLMDAVDRQGTVRVVNKKIIIKV